MRLHVLGILAFVGTAWMAPLWASTAQAAESASSPYSLPSIIALALERNPTVAGAQAVIDKKVGQRITAGAYPNPSVTGNSGYGEIRDTGRADIRDLLTTQSLTEYNMTVGQPLEWPAKRAARQGAAEAGVAEATAGWVEIRLNLTAAVKITFYELLLAQRDLELAQLNLQTVEDVRRIVKARVRLGEAPQFELIKADVEVLKANQAVTRAENMVRVGQVALDTLTAGALGPSFTVTGEFESPRHGLSLDALLAEAVTRHPTLKRFTNLIEQAERTLEFERQARVPNVTLNASYWREIGREAIQAGLSFPTPLWYQRQGEIAIALGEKRREEVELLRARNILAKEVNQYFQDVKTAATLVEVFEKGLMKQAKEALRMAQFSFQQGAASLLEVLDAQRVQRDILLDYAQARFNLSVALARLERAAGGSL
jgi:cobalt-zinc-cadmium efflux system outer membrane protein